MERKMTRFGQGYVSKAARKLGMEHDGEPEAEPKVGKVLGDDGVWVSSTVIGENTTTVAINYHVLCWVQVSLNQEHPCRQASAFVSAAYELFFRTPCCHFYLSS